MDKKTYIIHGHYELELIPDHLYRIRYGIHQGIYKYCGRPTAGFWKDAYWFEDVESGQPFTHYASHPYEFTLCVEPYND